MKIGIYCNFIADILTKVFIEMFVEWSSTKHILFVQISQFGWLSWQPKGSICEKYKKNQLLRSYMGDETETLQKCS